MFFLSLAIMISPVILTRGHQPEHFLPNHSGNLLFVPPYTKTNLPNAVTDIILTQTSPASTQSSTYLIQTVYGIMQTFSVIFKTSSSRARSLKTLETPILYVLCDNLIFDVFSHATTSCPPLKVQHSEWWNSITNLFDIRLEAELCALLENELFLILLGRPTQTDLSNFKTFVFKKMNANHIVISCAFYNRLCNQQIQQKNSS